MKAGFILALSFVFTLLKANAQCPDQKTIHYYSQTNTTDSKNNGEIKVEIQLNKNLSFVVLDLVNQTVINPIISKKNTNTSTIANFGGLAAGEYKIDVYLKGCPYSSKLSVGNPSIIIK